MKLKKILNTITTLVLMVCLTVPTLATLPSYGEELQSQPDKQYTQMFDDVPKTHWAFEKIAELVDRGAINGYPDGKFYPEKTVNREEFAKIMVLVAGLKPVPVWQTSFADISATYWAAPFIEISKPYMTAYENKGGQPNFRPQADALREDIAVAIVKLKGYDTRLADLSLLNTMFSDIYSISESARPYIALAIENELISGYPDGTFRGQDTVERAEAATMLWRAFQYGSDDKVVADNLIPEVPEVPEVPVIPEVPDVPVPEPEKPFVIDTVADANITNTQKFLTMDNNSNLIYYDADSDKILSLDTESGKTKTLLNVSSATFTMEVESDAATMSTEGIDEVEKEEPEPNPTITYTDLEVYQVFWDDVANELLVVGEFQAIQSPDDGWEAPEGEKKTMECVFTLSGGDLLYSWDVPGRSDFVIYTALDNGNYIVYSSAISSEAPIYNPDSGKIMTELSYYHDDSASGNRHKFMQIGSDIYQTDSHTNTISKYDYGTGRWNTVYDKSFSGIYCQNEVFYTWSDGDSDDIKAIKPDGQTKTMFKKGTDVEVLDYMAMPAYVHNFFVTEDESYLFYDSSNHVIRMISPNPDAE